MPNDLGMQIRNARREKHVTLIELADHAGISQDYLAKIELGEIQPSKEDAQNILSIIENWRKAGPFTGDMKYPEDFKSFRKKCRMTIIELSEITGISQEKIAEFEQGLVSLPEETIQSLISALENPCGFSKN